MHTHIQNSIPLAVFNATMNILLPHQEHNSTYVSSPKPMSSSGGGIQLSDAAIAVSIAMPYDYSGKHQGFSTILTRHQQCSQAVNMCLLVLVLTWAFWERIWEIYAWVDDWVVDQCVEEDQRVWREAYRRTRRNLKLVSILKKRWRDGEGEARELDLSESGSGSDSDSEYRGEIDRDWTQIVMQRRRKNRRVVFANDVKMFDGERASNGWDPLIYDVQC